MALPCYLFQRGDQDFNLTPEERRPIWEYAKANYFDHGVSFEDAITDLTNKTGLPARLFAEAFAGPKSARVMTNEIYRRQAARNAARADAEFAIRNADSPQIVKVFKAITALPRAILTFGHGPVFPVTHGGSLLLRPTEWTNFAKGWLTAVKSFNPDTHLALRQKLVTDDYYAMARQAGLEINPDKGPQGIFSAWLAGDSGGKFAKFGAGWSKRAWLGLQVMRLELWKSDMSRFLAQAAEGTLSETDLKSIAAEMAQIANHATGVTNWQLGPIGKVAFAPQLTASKVARAVVDPINTLNTFARMATGMGKQVTAGEKFAAYKRLGNMAEFLAVTYAGLQLNQALMHVLGSNQTINFTNPRKPDFWRFKTGDGHVLSTRGPEEIMRLAGDLIAIFYSSKKELKGESQRQAVFDSISKFVQYKLSPGIGLGIELASGRDVFLRPLPPEIQKARALLGMKPQEGTEKKAQYTALEYASQHGPIFLGGGARDLYNNLRERGMSAADTTALFRASLVSAGEFFGFGAYEENQQQDVLNRLTKTRQIHRKILRRIANSEEE